MDRVEQFVRVETHSILLGSLLLACLLLAVVIYLRNRQAQTGDTILLVGPSDGGKTAIFSSLVYNHAPQTHTSLQQNTALFRSPSPFHGRALRIVDIPGHPRIRGQFAEYLRGEAKAGNTAKLAGVKGVVFVCDAAALTRNASTVAEHLHLIMSAIANLPPSIPAPPLLVFANKSDLLPKGMEVLPNATLALSRTQTILERELEKRRQASLSRGQTGAGGGVLSELGEDADAAGEGTALGGLDVADEGEGTFSFDKWEAGEVEVRSGWVNVKRNGGKEGESDSEGESPVRGEKSEKKGDGLVKLVEWVAALR